MPLRPSHKPGIGRPAAMALAAALALSACSMFRGGGTPGNEPTLKTLANRKVSVDKEDVAAVDEKKAIEAYRKFLDIAPGGAAALGGDAPARRPRDGQRRQRQQTPARSATRPTTRPRSRAAPGVPQELSRRIPTTTASSTRWHVPTSRAAISSRRRRRSTAWSGTTPERASASEAQFRRGASCCSPAKDYAGAEKAFAVVLASPPDASPYQDRSLYMLGWSQYKQGRLDDGLKVVLRRPRPQDRRPRGRGRTRTRSPA